MTHYTDNAFSKLHNSSSRHDYGDTSRSDFDNSALKCRSTTINEVSELAAGEDDCTLMRSPRISILEQTNPNKGRLQTLYSEERKSVKVFHT